MPRSALVSVGFVASLLSLFAVAPAAASFIWPFGPSYSASDAKISALDMRELEAFIVGERLSSYKVAETDPNRVAGSVLFQSRTPNGPQFTWMPVSLPASAANAEAPASNHEVKFLSAFYDSKLMADVSSLFGLGLSVGTDDLYRVELTRLYSVDRPNVVDPASCKLIAQQISSFEVINRSVWLIWGATLWEIKVERYRKLSGSAKLSGQFLFSGGAAYSLEQGMLQIKRIVTIVPPIKVDLPILAQSSQSGQPVTLTNIAATGHEGELQRSIQQSPAVRIVPASEVKERLGRVLMNASASEMRAIISSGAAARFAPTAPAAPVDN